MSILQLSGVGLNPGGKVVFRDLDWTIQPRERTGLVGANGCGKSSLLKVIAGLTPADEGGVVGPLHLHKEGVQVYMKYAPHSTSVLYSRGMGRKVKSQKSRGPAASTNY